MKLRRDFKIDVQSINNNKTISLVYLFEPGFKVKIVHVPLEEVKFYKQDMISHDVDRNETWLHWIYLGEFE